MERIAVVGAGGVGGYLAAMLAQALPNVTVVARGARGISMREKGVVLHSDYQEDVIAHPAHILQSSRELPCQDLIFLSVKNYSLKEACEELRGAVGERTVVVPVMNGVDTADRVRSYLGKGIVLDALIYIVAFAREDYSIFQQGNFASLRIGRKNASEEETEMLEEVSDLLNEAGIQHKISRDIELDIWRKYILNCAYNVETAYYDETIGELRADPAKAKEYEELVWEAYRVACAKGVKLEPRHAQSVIDKFYHDVAEDATSSLQRDLREGKPAELETFSGYLVREGERLNVPVPVSAHMYEGLRERTKE